MPPAAVITSACASLHMVRLLPRVGLHQCPSEKIRPKDDGAHRFLDHGVRPRPYRRALAQGARSRLRNKARFRESHPTGMLVSRRMPTTFGPSGAKPKPLSRGTEGSNPALSSRESCELAISRRIADCISRSRTDTLPVHIAARCPCSCVYRDRHSWSGRCR